MRREKSGKPGATLLFAQVLIRTFRIYFRISEWTASPARRKRLQSFRSRMTEIEREKRKTLAAFRNGDAVEKMEAIDSMMRMSGVDEENSAKERREQIENLKADREERQKLNEITAASGDILDMVQTLRGYLMEHPHSYIAWSMLGRTLKNIGEWDEGIVAFQSAAMAMESKSKENGIVYLAIAGIMSAQGRHSDAVNEYERIIREAPRKQVNLVASAWLGIGDALRDSGDKLGARGAWRKAIKIGANSAVKGEVRKRLQSL